MKLVTKFNIGDPFFTIDNGKIIANTVNFLSVTVSVSGSEEIVKTDISYFPTVRMFATSCKEEQMFKTKRLLLKSLQS